jgi:outer membrane receptor protein involved in Fe transport
MGAILSRAAEVDYNCSVQPIPAEVSAMRSNAALTLAWLFAPALAFAQSPAPTPTPSPLHSEYLEVVATRVPEAPDEVPAAIDVLTGDELADRRATDLHHALGLLGGVDVAPGGDNGPASSVPEFWGLKEFDAFLLVVDGVPWGGAFNPALATLSLEDVQRIEVLRGPAPVMYGATSFVGVIHVVRRDPVERDGTLRLTGGSYGSAGGVAAVGLPRALGFDSRLAADLTRARYSDDRTGFDRGHVLWRSGRGLGGGRFRLDIDGTWLDQDPASPTPREGTALSTRVPIDANHNPEGAFLNERRFFAATGYDHTLGRGSWTTTLSFTRSSQDSFRGFLADLDATPFNARGQRGTIDENHIYFDTHFSWTASPRWKLVAGADHMHAEADGRGTDFDYFAPLDGSVAPAVPEPTVFDKDIADRREFSGLYAYAEWNPSSAWRVQAGLRLNRTQERRGEEEGGAESAAEEAGREREEVRPSRSAGVTWTAWQRGPERLRLFAAYNDAFKPAAIDFNFAEEEAGGERILEPETARSVEAGIKSVLAGGRLELELSAFRMKFHNLVVAQAVAGLPSLANAGSERFRGIEVEASWQLADKLRARAAYSLHDARFADYLTEFDGVPTQLSGNRLEMSARHMGAAGLLYTPPRGLLAAAELRLIGSRYLNKRNTALAPGYAELSASLGWRVNKWEARIDGRNLGDQRDPVSESELGDSQYYRLPARRIELSLIRRF